MAWNFDKVTKRASAGEVFATMPAATGLSMEHRIPLQGEVCKFSHEPAAAYVLLNYTTDGHSLEVVALERALHKLWKESKGLEDAAEAWRNALHADLSVEVYGELVATLTSGQVVTIRW
jgi:hypothetical protein